MSGTAAMLKLEDLARTVQDIERLLKKYTTDKGPAGWGPQFGEGILDFSNYNEMVIQKNPSTLPKISSDIQSFPTR